MRTRVARQFQNIPSMLGARSAACGTAPGPAWARSFHGCETGFWRVHVFSRIKVQLSEQSSGKPVPADRQMHSHPSPIGPKVAMPTRRAHTPLSLYLILVCVVGSTGGFLFGFDTSVISGVIEYIANPKVFNLGEIAKGWTVSCIIIGCMIGCVLAGPLSSRFGRKKTLLLTAIVFLVSSLGCALSHSLAAF